MTSSSFLYELHRYTVMKNVIGTIYNVFDSPIIGVCIGFVCLSTTQPFRSKEWTEFVKICANMTESLGFNVCIREGQGGNNIDKVLVVNNTDFSLDYLHEDHSYFPIN